MLGSYVTRSIFRLWQKKRVRKLQRATQFFRTQFTLRLSACSSELQSIRPIFNSSQEQAQRLPAVSSDLWYCKCFGLSNKAFTVPFFRAFKFQCKGLRLHPYAYAALGYFAISEGKRFSQDTSWAQAVELS